jgi:hypothetical protein
MGVRGEEGEKKKVKGKRNAKSRVKEEDSQSGGGNYGIIGYIARGYGVAVSDRRERFMDVTKLGRKLSPSPVHSSCTVCKSHLHYRARRPIVSR